MLTPTGRRRLDTLATGAAGLRRCRSSAAGHRQGCSRARPGPTLRVDSGRRAPRASDPVKLPPTRSIHAAGAGEITSALRRSRRRGRGSGDKRHRGAHEPGAARSPIPSWIAPVASSASRPGRASPRLRRRSFRSLVQGDSASRGSVAGPGLRSAGCWHFSWRRPEHVMGDGRRRDLHAWLPAAPRPLPAAVQSASNAVASMPPPRRPAIAAPDGGGRAWAGAPRDDAIRRRAAIARRAARGRAETVAEALVRPSAPTRSRGFAKPPVHSAHSTRRWGAGTQLLQRLTAVSR